METKKAEQAKKMWNYKKRISHASASEKNAKIVWVRECVGEKEKERESIRPPKNVAFRKNDLALKAPDISASEKALKKCAAVMKRAE